VSYGFEVYNDGALAVSQHSRVTNVIGTVDIAAGSSGSAAFSLGGRAAEAVFIPTETSWAMMDVGATVVLDTNGVSWSYAAPPFGMFEHVAGKILIYGKGQELAGDHGIALLDDSGRGVIGQDYYNFMFLERGNMSLNSNVQNSAYWECTFAEPVPTSVNMVVGFCSSGGYFGQGWLKKSGGYYTGVHLFAPKGVNSWVEYCVAVEPPDTQPAGSGYGVEIYRSDGSLSFSAEYPYIHLGAADNYILPNSPAGSYEIARVSDYSSNAKWYACTLGCGQHTFQSDHYQAMVLDDALKGVGGVLPTSLTSKWWATNRYPWKVQANSYISNSVAVFTPVIDMPMGVYAPAKSW